MAYQATTTAIGDEFGASKVTFFTVVVVLVGVVVDQLMTITSTTQVYQGPHPTD